MGKGKEPGAVQGEKQEVMPGIPQKEKESGLYFTIFYYSIWFVSSEILKYLFKNFCTDSEMTHIENNDLKWVMNAMKMRKYRENLSGQKKELYLKKERMRQAKIRLEKKCETQLQHEKNRLHQQKCHLLKLVPESPSKFKHAFKAMCKLANASPHKQEIINDC